MGWQQTYYYRSITNGHSGAPIDVNEPIAGELDRTGFAALPFAASLVYSKDPPVQGRRRGRRGAVSHPLEEWAPRVYRFALRLCDDPHAAEDLTQETLLRAWRYRTRLREPRAGAVWLLRITANLWRDRLRRGRCRVDRAVPLQDDAPSRTPGPEQLASKREELRRALDALGELPPRQREVLYLSACEGLSTAEIGEILGIESDAVKASLWLARKNLRERLGEAAGSPTQLE